MNHSLPSILEILPSALINTFYNTGEIRFAFCIPAKELMNKAGLRHAPCYAWVITKCGRLWMFQSQGQAWDLDMLTKAIDLLSHRLEKMDWPSLTFALTDLDVPRSAQVIGPRFPLGLGLHLVDSGRLTNAFMSQWLLGQRNPDLVSPRAVQDQLRQHLDECINEVLLEFRHVACESLSFSVDSAIDLDVNNCVAGQWALERRQFTSLFPALAGKVFAHNASQFWRGIRSAIDSRKSAVQAIARQLGVRRSAIRALKGVYREQMGEYFFGHIEELIRILDQIPVEHQPASPEMWSAFCSSYSSAKKVFGQSDSARLVIVARLKNALKWLVKSGSIRDPGFGVNEARSIDLFRQGLIGTVLVARSSDIAVSPDSALSKAEVHLRIDRFLGTLSWQRLVTLSSKWSQALATAVQSRTVELEFVQSNTSFFDFLGGIYLTANGHQIETLTSTAAFRRQGDAMGICLRHASYRSDYADASARGRRTILAISNSERRMQSTLELDVRLGSDADGRDKVHFDVLQHQGRQNNAAPSGALAAVSELFLALGTPGLQARALQGIRLSAAKPRGTHGVEPVNFTLAVAGRAAFNLTFGDKGEEIWKRLES